MSKSSPTFIKMLKLIADNGEDGKRLVQSWKGTIGIIGLNPSRVAVFNEELIKCGNLNGFTQDWHFPETIAIGIRTKHVKHLENQGEICRDYGADLIVLADQVDGSDVKKTLGKNLHLPVFSLTGKMSDLATEALNESMQVKKIVRPDTLFHADEEEMRSNIKKDIIGREKRMKKSESFNGYPILNDHFVGVIGGAGPLASAEFCKKLALTQTPFIHCSVNSAPGKHYFEMGDGPSYLDHYRSTYGFLKRIGASQFAIPCNTAHKRLSEYIDKDGLPRIVDIRKSVLEMNQNEEGFILLGTNRTTGVGLPSGEVGTYEILRKDYPDQGPFFIPSVEQQNRIMKAIYDVKAGQFDSAKSEILSVISELREENGHRRVILGCTELPLAFNDIELAEHELIDPADDMATMAKRRIDEISLQKRVVRLREEVTKLDGAPIGLKGQDSSK